MLIELRPVESRVPLGVRPEGGGSLPYSLETEFLGEAFGVPLGARPSSVGSRAYSPEAEVRAPGMEPYSPDPRLLAAPVLAAPGMEPYSPDPRLLAAPGTVTLLRGLEGGVPAGDLPDGGGLF
ncbi:MAG: hypothetical protein JNJ83_18335 [Verrucomicrobiaceae bacterium]|nr:hypothetical protein [Verrucomicrobiaceae bacterium]